MGNLSSALQVPYRDQIADAGGNLTRPWETFFRYVKDALDPLGVEKIVPIVNYQATVKPIKELTFSSTSVCQAVVEYVIQRITTGVGASELVESGTMHLVYKPVSNAWYIVVIGSPGPNFAGVVFSITAAGVLQYTSSNFSGTPSISRMIFRARTLSGKNSSYSTVGPLR
jgi:hypothetical protein